MAMKNLTYLKSIISKRNCKGRLTRRGEHDASNSNGTNSLKSLFLGGKVIAINIIIVIYIIDITNHKWSRQTSTRLENCYAC